jgi:hypothetical protein
MKRGKDEMSGQGRLDAPSERQIANSNPSVEFSAKLTDGEPELKLSLA